MFEKEAMLAEFWREKSGLAWSDFDAIGGKKPPPGIGARGEAVVFSMNGKDAETQLAVILGRVSMLIFRGFPLSEGEFHLAIAASYLLTDLPYVEFFKTRWWENNVGRGYGDPPWSEKGAEQNMGE